MDHLFSSTQRRSRAIRRWALTSTAIAALLVLAAPAAAAIDCPPIVIAAHVATHKVPIAVHGAVAPRPHRPAVRPAGLRAKAVHRKTVHRKAGRPKFGAPAAVAPGAPAPAVGSYRTANTYVGPVVRPRECASRPVELATAPPMSPAARIAPAPAVELLTSLLPPFVNPQEPPPFTPEPPVEVFTPPEGFRPPLAPPPAPPAIFLPVPEPATWAMMLLGFLGVGAALRFRRARLPHRRAGAAGGRSSAA